MVEFALAAMALLLITFGTIDFGRAVYEYNVIANSAREGARVAIIQANPDAAIIERTIASSGGLIAPRDVALGGTRVCAAIPCGTVTVSVSREYRPATPFVAAIVGDALVMRASSTMVVER